MLRTLALHVCRQRKPNYGILVPLIYAPLLPLSEACSSPMLLRLSYDLTWRKSNTIRVICSTVSYAMQGTMRVLLPALQSE